ncbi:hypothetical protein MOP88_03465 [Sphingomonas sp. WKB10]|nr:hypothetical protein [Sphingomonas sp. WKB10]
MAFCLLALELGAALGWQRGKMMRIMFDPETHRLNQTSSPRRAAVHRRPHRRAQRGAGGDELCGGAFDPMAATDVLMALALGLFAAQRLEMYLRGKRMLEAARWPARRCAVGVRPMRLRARRRASRVGAAGGVAQRVAVGIEHRMADRPQRSSS